MSADHLNKGSSRPADWPDHEKDLCFLPKDPDVGDYRGLVSRQSPIGYLRFSPLTISLRCRSARDTLAVIAAFLVSEEPAKRDAVPGRLYPPSRIEKKKKRALQGPLCLHFRAKPSRAGTHTRRR